MAKSPFKQGRRLPRNITEKTDREVMTRLFGKRVMTAVDRVLEEHDGQDVTSVHNEPGSCNAA